MTIIYDYPITSKAQPITDEILDKTIKEYIVSTERDIETQYIDEDEFELDTNMYYIEVVNKKQIRYGS